MGSKRKILFQISKFWGRGPPNLQVQSINSRRSAGWWHPEACTSTFWTPKHIVMSSMARNTTLDRASTRMMWDLTFKCLASPTLILNLRLLCSELEICSQLELAALPTLIINVWWLIEKTWNLFFCIWAGCTPNKCKFIASRTGVWLSWTWACCVPCFSFEFECLASWTWDSFSRFDLAVIPMLFMIVWLLIQDSSTLRFVSHRKLTPLPALTPNVGLSGLPGLSFIFHILS